MGSLAKKKEMQNTSTVKRTADILFHSIFLISLGSRCYYYSDVTTVETET